MVNKILIADNIIGSCSHIQESSKYSNKNVTTKIASIDLENIYYHNLTFIVRKFLTSLLELDRTPKPTTHQLFNG